MSAHRSRRLRRRHILASGHAEAGNEDTDAFTHETVGKALLGVDGDGPRW
jgi:hypothetical protein